MRQLQQQDQTKTRDVQRDVEVKNRKEKQGKEHRKKDHKNNKYHLWGLISRDKQHIEGRDDVKNRRTCDNCNNLASFEDRLIPSTSTVAEFAGEYKNSFGNCQGICGCEEKQIFLRKT